ncbi:MAG: T9SS type A sorting domain-containing protein [Candidatus Zixiibacteriota bacterium]
MRRNFHLSLVLALAFLFSLSTLAIADRAVVDGTVSDVRTGWGIEGADVTVWNFWQPEDTVGSDITDEDGYYWIEMDVSLTDTFVVEAKATGFRTKRANFAPEFHGDSLRIDFSLRGPHLQQFDSSLVVDTLAPGDSSLFERVMTNIGRVAFEYTVEEDADWIVATPTSGTIPWLGDDTLYVWLYALTSQKQVYEDTIVIENNSASPAIHIPVMLVVPLGVEEQEGSKLPRSFALRRCYPNPFNASTTIGYDLPRASRVTLEIYNLVGQKVATLVNDYQQAGYKTVNWNAAEVTTGIYYYKLTAGEFVSVRKLTILK